MDKEKNRENFGKCLAYLRKHLHKLGGRELYIGFGERDCSHPWLEKEFQGRTMSLQINPWSDDLDVDVEVLGSPYTQVYGYEQKSIDRWREGYRGTGMVCPGYRHTWEELDVVPFLLEWKRIEAAFDAEIEKYESLDNFEV